ISFASSSTRSGFPAVVTARLSNREAVQVRRTCPGDDQRAGGQTHPRPPRIAIEFLPRVVGFQRTRIHREEVVMRRTAALLLALALAAGCASSGPPVAPAVLAETEAAVHRAESAGARERAADLLAKARRAWDEGRLASTRGEGEIARH